MTRVVVLDSGPLGRLAHSKREPGILNWFESLIAAGVNFVVPEIADYEVRRELIRAGMLKSIRELDNMKANLTFLPIDSDVMLSAAEIWAKARTKGRPTAGQGRLDADAILAAQANSLSRKDTEVIVASDNVGHLNEMTTVRYWHDILAIE